MPVTARLSKGFYDRLGDDVAGELVNWLNQMDVASRATLHELNELNFARFETKLEQRDAKLDQRFAMLDQRFSTLDQRFSTLDQRFGTLEQRFEKVAADLSAVRTEMHDGFAHQRVELAEGLAKVRAEMSDGTAKVRAEMSDRMLTVVDSNRRWVIGLWTVQMLAFFGMWLARP